MNVHCPHCNHTHEVSDTLLNKVADCPSCHRRFVVKRESPRPGHRRSGCGPLVLCIALLAVGALAFACWKQQANPVELARRLVERFQPKPSAAPSAPAEPEAMPVVYEPSEPEPSPTAPVAPESETPVATSPSVEPSPAPAVKIDPLAWLLESRTRWPQEVSLVFAVRFTVKTEGQAVGSVLRPPGSLVTLLGIEGDQVTVAYQSQGRRIPMEATDLLERTRHEIDRRAALLALAAARTSAKTSSTAPVTQPAATTETTELDADLMPVKSGPFVHPGLLHDEEDFRRMRFNKGREPWKSGWERLVANRHSSLDYKPRPVEVVVRGGDAGKPQNYALLFNDVAAAYACALRWRISGERGYAEKSIEIMNAWSSTLKDIIGGSDVALAAGIYGYQFANAAEIMRTYKGWKPEDFARFQKMMRERFLPTNQDFLKRHNNRKIDHYWANWDLCNMASMMAIGVLCDDRSLYNEVIRYYKFGKGNGCIKLTVNFIHPDGLGQWQEAGRDQGHTVMGIGLVAAICEMAWKQGDDLYGYDNNRFLAGAEYVAKYNLGEAVPFHTYVNTSHGTQTEISDAARGNLRPAWELVYNHYVKRKGLPASYTAKMLDKVRPEGGGGDYGPNSGGFDQLGYGTLTSTLDRVPALATR
jgi:hypothetical protein